MFYIAKKRENMFRYLSVNVPMYALQMIISCEHKCFYKNVFVYF